MRINEGVNFHPERESKLNLSERHDLCQLQIDTYHLLLHGLNHEVLNADFQHPLKGAQGGE